MLRLQASLRLAAPQITSHAAYVRPNGEASGGTSRADAAGAATAASTIATATAATVRRRTPLRMSPPIAFRTSLGRPFARDILIRANRTQSRAAPLRAPPPRSSPRRVPRGRPQAAVERATREAEERADLALRPSLAHELEHEPLLLGDRGSRGDRRSPVARPARPPGSASVSRACASQPRYASPRSCGRYPAHGRSPDCAATGYERQHLGLARTKACRLLHCDSRYGRRPVGTSQFCANLPASAQSGYRRLVLIITLAGSFAVACASTPRTSCSTSR